MIRGAIDYIDRERVGGWIYTPLSTLEGNTVLAFHGPNCVGAGVVEIFRPDLADAGLGDGNLGFSFGISLGPDADETEVVIKLEGSDLFLKQASASVRADAVGGLAPGMRQHSVDDIEWMRSRGWLVQTDFDFLRAITTVGLFDRSLRDGARLFDPKAEAKALLELYAQTSVDLREEKFSPADLVQFAALALKEGVTPVCAIYAQDVASVAVVEGSQHDADIGGVRDLTGAVNYRCGADRLIFVDLRCALEGRGAQDITVFWAR